MKPFLTLVVCAAILYGIDAYFFDGRYFATLQQMFWNSYYSVNH
jgi:hypothetical protein